MHQYLFIQAMYKTRNTGTGNGMRGTRRIRGMLYSGECGQTFRGMSSNIPRNVAKHSRECPQTFRGMSPNIPGNVLKHSGECRQIFRGMSPNIPGKNNIWHVACSMWHVVKHSVESMKDFG